MAVVILAEKPDQGKKFATALAGKTPVNKGGKYEFRSELFGDTIVTWGIGHLVGLSLPEKYEWLPSKDSWSLSNVPFLPKEKEMKYEVSKGKNQQFTTVKSCLENADMIIIATDPDREGENIAYNIFKLCKKSIFNIPMKRLWINSLVKSEIVKGFKNLREANETVSYFKEANARQIADYLVGMNYTELFTLKLQEKGVQGVVSVGRVQTPVNTLVVENDLAIKEFKSEKFKVIECLTRDKEPQTIFKNSQEYFDMAEFEEVTKKFGLDSASKGIIKSIEVTQKQTEPQKLFSLGGIQEYANTRWKYSSKKTTKVIQDLYDRGFLSYPRTDSELITTSEFEYLKDNLNSYKELLGLEVATPCLEANKRFVNNEKVLEHYALIPTMELPKLEQLNDEERNIYEIILKRTCLMFAEPYKYENTKVILDVNGLEFQASGNVPVSLGWKQVDQNIDEKTADKEDITLPKFYEGENIQIEVCFREKWTKEPKRLTEGKLVGKRGIMAKLGLGTPATRSSIVETLIAREYIKIENTKVYPTAKGYLLWDLTKNKDLLIGKPETTAQWEQALSKIAKQQYTREEFLKNIYKYVDVTVQSLKNSEFDSVYLEDSTKQNVHEVNDYLIEEKPKVFEITKKSTDDKFIIFKNISNKKINLKTVEELLKNGRTKKPISGFKSKNNKKFSAVLIFDEKEKKISMEFDNGNKENSGTENVCEIASYLVKEKEKVFEITVLETKEQFIIYKTNSGKTITIDIIKELLENGKTTNKITGFKSKENREYSAYLIFDVATKRITKEF